MFSCVFKAEGNWVTVNKSNGCCRKERKGVLRGEERLQTREETNSGVFWGVELRLLSMRTWGDLWESNEFQPHFHPTEKWGMRVFWWQAERLASLLTRLILRTVLVCPCTEPFQEAVHLDSGNTVWRNQPLSRRNRATPHAYPAGPFFSHGEEQVGSHSEIPPNEGTSRGNEKHSFSPTETWKRSHPFLLRQLCLNVGVTLEQGSLVPSSTGPLRETRWERPK